MGRRTGTGRYWLRRPGSPRAGRGRGASLRFDQRKRCERSDEPVRRAEPRGSTSAVTSAITVILATRTACTPAGGTSPCTTAS
jgi:hypothetical protein